MIDLSHNAAETQNHVSRIPDLCRTVMSYKVACVYRDID
jgi:hypothetical protein